MTNACDRMGIGESIHFLLPSLMTNIVRPFVAVYELQKTKSSGTCERDRVDCKENSGGDANCPNGGRGQSRRVAQEALVDQ